MRHPLDHRAAEPEIPFLRFEHVQRDWQSRNGVSVVLLDPGQTLVIVVLDEKATLPIMTDEKDGRLRHQRGQFETISDEPVQPLARTCPKHARAVFEEPENSGA